MEIRQLIHDDDAVSPVIGVILMVAITVILAAVIATFVLGLGDQVSSTAPQASFSFQYDEGDGTGGILSVTHNSGDPIRADELYIRGQNGTDDDARFDDTWKSVIENGFSDDSYGGGESDIDDNIDGSASGELSGTSAVTGGDYLEFPVGTEGNVRVIYQSRQGDSSATISTWTGPDA